MNSINYEDVTRLLKVMDRSVAKEAKNAQRVTRLTTKDKEPKPLDKISFICDNTLKEEIIDKSTILERILKLSNKYIKKYENKNEEFLELKGILDDKLKELRLLRNNETLTLDVEEEEGCADKISKRLNTTTSTLYTVAVSILTVTAFGLGYLANSPATK